MVDGKVLVALSEAWRSFGRHDAADVPVYAAICTSVADDQDVLALQASGPRSAWNPAMFLAAAHHLVLSGVDHPLAAVYAGRRPAHEAARWFRSLVLEHSAVISATLAERRVQTNEVGRSALIAVGLAAAARRAARPLQLIEAGASAGLNLLFDRYHLDYGAAGSLGPVSSPVQVHCRCPPDWSVPDLPHVASRVGIDRRPLDPANDDDARWLLACTWPTSGRLDRTRRALDLARRESPVVLDGDAATCLAEVASQVPAAGTLVILTTSTIGYLDARRRRRFKHTLVDLACGRSVIWVWAEPDRAATGCRSYLGCTVVDRSRLVHERLAEVHPHGSWLRPRSGRTGSAEDSSVCGQR